MAKKIFTVIVTLIFILLFAGIAFFPFYFLVPDFSFISIFVYMVVCILAAIIPGIFAYSAIGSLFEYIKSNF